MRNQTAFFFLSAPGDSKCKDRKRKIKNGLTIFSIKWSKKRKKIITFFKYNKK